MATTYNLFGLGINAPTTQCLQLTTNNNNDKHLASITVVDRIPL